MTAIELLTLVTELLLISLSVVVVIDFVRQRDAIRRDIMLTFLALATPHYIQLLVPPVVANLSVEVLTALGFLSFFATFAQPFLMLCLLRYFRPVPAWVVRASAAGMVLSWFSIYLLSRGPSSLLTLLVIVYFVLVDGYTMVQFVRGALSTSGVTRQRLRFAAIGCALLSLILIVIGIQMFFPTLQLVSPLVALAAAIGAGLAFYAAFAPPRWLVRSWQAGEFQAFLLNTASVETPFDYRETDHFDALCSAAKQAVGASAAAVLQLDAARSQWALRSASDPALFTEAIQMGPTVFDRVKQTRASFALRRSGRVSEMERALLKQADANVMLAAPIAAGEQIWGVLVAFLRYGSLFVEDDLRLLRLLAQHSAILLENSAMVQQLQSYSQQLEGVVEERTAALRESEARNREHLEKLVEQRTAEANRSKRRVEAILNNSADGIVLAYTDTGIEQSNITFNRLLACGPDDFFGQPLTALVQAEDRERLTALIQAVLTDRVSRHGEFRVARKDGSVFEAQLGIGYIHPGEMSAAGLVCNLHDITALKERERLLRYHASLQENVTDAVISTDLDLHIQTWNRAAEQIYGWRAEEVIGKVSHDILKTESLTGIPREQVVSDFMQVGYWNGEVRQRHRDGHLLHILGSTVLFKDENGQPLGLVAVNRDISQRKRAEDALREQRDFLEQIINSVPEMILVKDRDGRFQLVNNVAAQIYGIAAADMVGKTDADMNPNEDEVAFFLQKDQETLDSGQAIFIPEETVLGRYYQTTKIPLVNQAGQYDRLLVVASDITKHKQAEDALRRAFEKEKELGELKSRFVSMSSHEFRTPLASILAITETLGLYRAKMTDEQIDQRLDRIREQVGHLKDVMDDVLQLARLQARRAEFNPSLIDLDALCRSILDEFQSRPDLNRRLLYSYAMAQREVKLDKKLMRQIVNNLVSNAIKYSPEGKTVTVRLEGTPETLVLKVSDEGIGIPEADLKHLFEPFHRAANVGTISGTGLGLVITKESVELHGGTINVESQVGIGTTFTVSIPIVAQQGAPHDKNTGDRG